MAEQETRERDDAGSSDATSETGSTTEGAQDDTTRTESSGADEGSSESSSESSQSSSESSSDTATESSSDTSSNTSSDTSSDSDAESSGGDSGSRTAARRSENHPKPQEPSDSDREAQEANRKSFLGGRSKSDDAPAGESRRSSVDLGELVWKSADVLATVIRVVTLVFAVVLVAHIALVVVGVNPANGVASFLRGFADTVVLGFRDLFLPADPTIALVVNYGVAAVFWVVVGGFVSAGIRFVAARVS